MRIETGIWRGRNLILPPQEHTRPTPHKVRAAIFNVLHHNSDCQLTMPFQDWTVLDAFAGSGAMGIEALSNGAARAIFFEIQPSTRRILQQNLQSLVPADRYRLYGEDVTQTRTPATPCQLIFLDPPYGKYNALEVLATLATKGWCAPECLAIVRVPVKEEIASAQGDFTTIFDRTYGSMRVVIFKRVMAKSTTANNNTSP